MSADPDLQHRSTQRRLPGAITNWVLALATILGSAALVVMAYALVMGTAACTDASSCEAPSEVLFTVLLYGPPVVSAVAIAATFFTAKRKNGIIVPVVAWILLAVDLVLLMASF